MKIRAFWLLIPVLGLGFSSCKKNEQPEAATPDAPGTAPAAETSAPPAQPSLDAETRASKLGFARHLPADTAALFSIYNGTRITENITTSRIWKLFGNEIGLATPDPAPGEPTGPAALFASEFTIAAGAAATDQTARLLTINNRSTYFQMKAIAKAFANSIKSGDMDDFEDAFERELGDQMIVDLIQDPESGIGLLEKLRMPPLYLAFRTSDEQRPGALQQLSSMVEFLGMFEDMVEPVEFERSGAKFAGYKILGKQIAASLEKEREEIEEAIGAENTTRLIKALAPKDIIAVSGSVGEYVLLFFGSSEDDLRFAETPDSSLAGENKLAFFDNYASKDLASVSFGDKAMIETLVDNAGGLAEIAGGIRDGLAASGGLGDTRDLEALLKLIGDREHTLLGMTTHDDAGIVAFFEQGLKIECFGGTDNHSINWDAPNTLAPLAKRENVFLFANATSDAAYEEAAQAYLEAIVETGYALANQVAQAPAQDGDLAQFQQMAQLFESKFRPDVVALWDALSGDFSDGLGSESALVIDLGGSFPPVPGVPQAVADEAKFPRVSLLAPVTDKDKLGVSWEKLNASATNIFKNVSELAGEDIPMPKPLSSERGGNTTWFFSMPFFNDDFLPSVTVGDKWFAASTSKTQALDLIAAADAGGETSTGFLFEMNFDVLRKFALETLDVVKTHQADLFGGSSNEKNLAQIQEVIDALDSLEKLTAHTRRENGRVRTSIHFKTR